jgi:hypothetical protein
MPLQAHNHREHGKTVARRHCGREPAISQPRRAKLRLRLGAQSGCSGRVCFLRPKLRAKLPANGIANQNLRLLCALAVGLAMASLFAGARGAEPALDHASNPAGPPEAWPTSPFHGVIDGATGEAIPCRCRFNGSTYRLGDTVCMNTHLGVQLARCDLNLNNTSWVPTGTACTLTRRTTHQAAR